MSFYRPYPGNRLNKALGKKLFYSKWTWVLNIKLKSIAKWNLFDLKRVIEEKTNKKWHFFEFKLWYLAVKSNYSPIQLRSNATLFLTVANFLQFESENAEKREFREE